MEGNAVVPCPNCKFMLNVEEDKLAKSYGNILMDDFLAKEAKINVDRRGVLDSSLSLTSEVNFNYDKFKIIITAHCGRCKYDYRFNHEENMKDLILIQKLAK
jgi:hypothetical protein